MFSRFLKWMFVSAATVSASVMLPASPVQADGPFFMTGTYEFNNAFALRRSIKAFVPAISTTGGALTIPANAFSTMGNPTDGAIFADAVCDPGPGSLTCMLGLPAKGFQAFPGFPEFAQLASTFTEMNVAPGQLGPGMGPGSLAFCPLVGNPANGVGTLPNCPGNALTAGGGVISSMGGLAINTGGAPFNPRAWGVPNTNTATSATFPLMGVPAGIGLGQGSPPGVQGNVQYRNGGGFGGTMSIARIASVVVSQRVGLNPTIFQHNLDDRTGSWAAGVPVSAQFSSQPIPGPQTRLPFTTANGGNTVNPMSPMGATGQNQAGLGPFTSIQTRGPIVNPGGGPAVTTTSTGFPWTTGQVLGQEDSCVIGGAPCPNTQQQFQMFLLTGSDARGPDGQGNLSLVSGGVLQERAGRSTVNWATLELNLTLPEPGTALGIGAGVMLLLGLSRRRFS